MHVNIRSLQKEINFDSFLDILATLKRKPDIICISETRIKEILVNIDIEGFDFVFTCPNFTSGGVGVYISNKLAYHVVKRNWLHCADCEDIWLSIANPSLGSVFNVIAIYRLPNTNIANFIDKLDEALDSHNLLNASTYILGDINININKFDRPAASQNYLDILCSHGLFPSITIPTRVSKTSATIIDHILTNDNTHQLYPGVIKTDLSDHYITFVTLCKLTEIASKHPSNKNKSKRRDMTKFSSEAFKDDLEKSLTNFMTFLPQITINNFNSEFAKFVDIFKSVVDKTCAFQTSFP